jgi:hypothetical protein
MKTTVSLRQLPMLVIAILQLASLKLQSQTIANPSFETPNVGATNGYFSYTIDPSGSSWAYTGNAGIAANGSGWNYYHRTVPDGKQYAFLQGISNTGATLSQTISNFPTGVYTFSFYASQRDIVGRDNSQNQSISASIDGLNMGWFTPADTNWYLFQVTPLPLTAGNHTLTFTNLAVPGDASILLDEVQVIAAAVASNSLIVDGIADVSGNIVFGTTATNLYAVAMSYTDSNPIVGITSTQPSSAFLWQDSDLTTPKNKLYLDGNNNLTVYSTSTNPEIILYPASSGGITLSNSGDKITFADTSSIISAYSLSAASYGVWYVTNNGSYNSLAVQAASVALGSASATGSNAVEIGAGASAAGLASTALGTGDQALTASSTAFGYNTKVSSYASVAFGQSNVGFVGTGGSNSWISTDPAIEVGSGTNSGSSDVLTIFKSGELRTAGRIQSKIGFRTPPSGVLLMGSFTNGLGLPPNPATLIPTNGLRYANLHMAYSCHFGSARE